MSKKLDKLEPENVFGFFEDISSIPRKSGNCKAISDFCVKFANDRGLKCLQDELGNVIIYKNASKGRENDKTVMLQAHLDMVCVKTRSSAFDFEKDSLKLAVDGDDLYAKETSLGGDDGIGVAMILAILDDTKLSTPPIEAVFTVDEEIGLLGAKALDLSNCKSEYLINLDSETDDVLWAGCAGGLTCKCVMPVTKESFRGVLAKIHISGLKGGHSGAEIDKERANANALMGRVLHRLSEKCLLSIVELEGGRADNVIPGKCDATISLDLNDQYFVDEKVVGKAPEDYKAKKIKEVEETVHEIYKEVHHEYKDSDPDIQIEIEVKSDMLSKCVDVLDTQKIIFFLVNCPTGVSHMSTSVEGLVDTSSNLAIVELKENEIEFLASVRSSSESRKKDLTSRIALLIQFLGGEQTTYGDYPGWEMKKSSKLRKQMSKVYKDMNGKKPEIQAIHAGLECGYFAKAMPHLDMVSIGPDIRDIHSYDEKLSISSTRKMYKYIVKVLAVLK